MKYTLRAVKYLAKLLILLALLFVFMAMSETSALSFDNWDVFFAGYFATWRGWLFTAAVIVWCAVYPRVEFVSRRSDYDMAEHKSAIVKALGAGGMVQAEKTEANKMIFRGESLWRRIWWMGEDTVTITPNASGSGVDIEGPRRFVSEAVQRIPLYINNDGQKN